MLMLQYKSCETIPARHDLLPSVSLESHRVRSECHEWLANLVRFGALLRMKCLVVQVIQLYH
jgi:hypothetical protein